MPIVSERMKRFSNALCIIGAIASLFSFVGVWIVEHMPSPGGLESIPPTGLSYEQKIALIGDFLVGFVALGLIGVIYLGCGAVLRLILKRKLS